MFWPKKRWFIRRENNDQYSTIKFITLTRNRYDTTQFKLKKKAKTCDGLCNNILFIISKIIIITLITHNERCQKHERYDCLNRQHYWVKGINMKNNNILTNI